jgi:alpha-galactosidase
MIPAMVDIARDVQNLCPEAWFFNYSNPLTATCWAVRKATGVPVVGLCHGTFRTARQLAQFIGAPPDEVTSLYLGLNHMTFIFDLRWRGRDAWPLARARLAQERHQPHDLGALAQCFPEMGAASDGFPASKNPFSWSLFETYGAFPAPGDRHVTEFFPERFPNGRYFGTTLGVDAFSFENTIAWGDEIYANMRSQALGERPLDERVLERAVGEHEQLLEILRSIEGDARQVFPVNLPNQGAAPNLPDEAVLELPAAATATGLRPLQVGDFPGPLAAVIKRKLAATELTVEAALSGDRELMSEALLADGAVNDPTVAHKLRDELLDAHRLHLPQFFG